MLLTLRLGIALALAVPGAAAADTVPDLVYFCETQAAAGLVWDPAKRVWSGTALAPDRRFEWRMSRLRQRLVQVDGDDVAVTDYAIAVTPAGGSRRPCGPRIVGSGDVVTAPDDGYLSCYTELTDYYFNPATKRILVVTIAGFLDGTDHGAATSSLSAGYCTERPQ